MCRNGAYIAPMNKLLRRRLPITMPYSMREDLEQVSKRMGISLNTVAMLALDEYLRRALYGSGSPPKWPQKSED